MDDLSFDLPRNGIVGVIGPNGVGKTTLFKMIVNAAGGSQRRDAGRRHTARGRHGAAVLRGPEPAGLDATKTVGGRVRRTGLHQRGKVEVPSRAYVSAFGFKGPDQQKPAKVLSGGERNRLNLALTLKMGGNVLLLDEPTNDLDVETLGSLENALRLPGCAVITSHDRWFLDRGHAHPWPMRATPSGSGSRATSRGTRRTRWSASARRPPVPTVPPTAN